MAKENGILTNNFFSLVGIVFQKNKLQFVSCDYGFESELA